MNFLDLDETMQNMLLVHEGKAKIVTGRTQGFSGTIAFLDNGEFSIPRYSAAKFPKRNRVLEDGEVAKRFLREIRIQSRMHYHTNVHFPHTLKMIAGIPVAYYRMWRGDLSGYIYNSTLSPDGKLAIIVQIANGLLHCRERSVTCHQDLKPENILIMSPIDICGINWPEQEPTLIPKIADFGSVDLFKEARVLRGTRPYMAPEQWGSATLTDKTQIFSLGVILYEFISCGIHPIGASSINWRGRVNPDFNRWQKDKFWIKWHIKNSLIVNPLPDIDIQILVEECLSPNPHHRPTLEQVIAKLLDAIAKRSADRYQQTLLFLREWDRNSSAEFDWKHLKDQLKRIEIGIGKRYGV